MAIFLKDNELDDAYNDAVKHTREFQKSFDEIERLSDNKVRTNIQKNYPKVNDGTLAGQLPEMAMRRFQQLFPGKFKVRDVDMWFNELLGLIWKNHIVPGADRDADFFTKFWLMVLDTQKYGAAASFSFFRNDANYTGADFTRLYIRDLLFEDGKISPTSANFMWANFYFTKFDIKRIIAQAEKEEEYAKANSVPSMNTWDIALLKDFCDRGPSGKDQNEQNPTERDKQLSNTHYKMAGLFHKGYKAPFLTTIPNMKNKVVRRRLNENPTGDIPINVIYAIQNLENAFGRGVVEQAAPTQNVLDIYTQADVLGTLLGLEPPTTIGGDTSKLQEKSLEFRPRAKWRIGSAEVKPVDLGSSVYTQLADRISRQKSNVLNQVGSFDTSIPAAAGNPQFSRTPAGTNSLDARGNAIDNFYITQIRKGFARQAELLMNIHLANMQGTEAMDIAKDEAKRLRKAGWDIGDASQIEIVYSEMEDIKAQFIPDEPNKANDPEKAELLEGIKLIVENPEARQEMLAEGAEIKLGKLYLKYLQKLDIEDLDEIIIINEPGQGGDTAPSSDDPQLELQETMAQYGISQNDAHIVMKARRSGISEEEIAQEIASRSGNV